MKISTYRKVGLTSCMLLAFAVGMPVFPASVYGQTQAPITSPTTAPAIPLANPIPSIASPLNSVTGAVNGVTSPLNSVTGTLNGVTGAVNGVTGTLNGVTGAVSGVTGAINGVTGAVNGITGTLNGVTGAVSGVTGAINGVTGALPTSVGGLNMQYVQLAASGLSAIQSGGVGAIPAVAQALNAQSILPSALQQTQLTQTLSALTQGGNINPTAAIGLVGGVLSGQLPSQVGTALASVQNLGNITSIGGLTQAIQGLQPALSGLAQGQLGGVMTQATALLSNPQLAQTISTVAGATQLAQQLGTAIPGLAQALGGNLTQQIQQMGTQILAAIGLPGGIAAAITNGLLGGVLGGALGGLIISSTAGVNNKTCAQVGSCCQGCAVEIPKHYQEVKDHVTSQFEAHRQWFLTTYWKDNILPALMLFAEQLSVAGIHQIEMVGSMLDAKHQLETQRLFQELAAQAHKDYQPSEGMCVFGTFAKSLVDSERRSDLVQLALAQRMTQRQAASGNNLAEEGVDSDMTTRLFQFRHVYCDKADNTNGLTEFCPNASANISRNNIDVDYTRNIESRLTLNLDLYPNAAAQSIDEVDLFALSANLFSHTIAPKIVPELLADTEGRIRVNAAEKYMDLRAIFAKRSVAQNSFAALASMRAYGDVKSAPYTKRLIYELGITDTAEINKYLGQNPSYFAQMEVLTKKLYQNPVFYTELYDKPVNVERKGAALQAIGLMQDRDLFNSLIRSEAVLSVLLETMLEREQEKVINAGKKMYGEGGSQ